MSITTSIRRVARPMIARGGGTHEVDLAVSDPTGGTAERGPMSQVSKYTDDNGDTETCYEPKTNATGRLDENVSRLAWPFGMRGGAGEVVVTSHKNDGDNAYQEEDVQPEPGPSDGEGQNSQGRQDDQDSKEDYGYRTGRGYMSYTKRNGGIG